MFRGKEDGVRVQGIITAAGGEQFEERREELSALYELIFGNPPHGGVSDADVIEFMARGKSETMKYLRAELRASK